MIYNRLDRRPEQRDFPYAMQHNLGILARVPLASGFLSGKYKPGARFAPDDTRGGQDPKEIDRKLREEMLQGVLNNQVCRTCRGWEN